MAAVFQATLSFTDAGKAAAPSMEAALENLLRNASIAESVIWALRINEITDCEVFSSLDSPEDGLKTNTADFGIDHRLHPAGPSLTHKRDMAQVISVWKQAKVKADTKTRTDAVARAHGEQFAHATVRLGLFYRFKESMAQRCKTK